ncbi:MAG: hypothetical protein ACREKJ_03735 [Candidatus Rokuibacteriota bacterium]
MIGAAAGSLGLLAAAVLVFWPPDPTDYPITPGRYQPDGETVGRVSKVESNIIHVNAGPFGGGVVALVVTRATRIMVGATEGWFEDIRPGGQVKVAYELHQGRRFARSVELLVDEGRRRPVRTPQLKGSAEAPPTIERAPVKGTPAPDARPAPPPEAAEPPPATPPVTAPAPAPTRGAATPEHNACAPVPTRTIESPRPSAPRPAGPARGTESGETTDGSAAVDWLLQGRR